MIFKDFLSPCALDKSSLSIERVKCRNSNVGIPAATAYGKTDDNTNHRTLNITV